MAFLTDENLTSSSIFCATMVFVLSEAILSCAFFFSSFCKIVGKKIDMIYNWVFLRFLRQPQTILLSQYRLKINCNYNNQKQKYQTIMESLLSEAMTQAYRQPSSDQPCHYAYQDTCYNKVDEYVKAMVENHIEGTQQDQQQSAHILTSFIQAGGGRFGAYDDQFIQQLTLLRKINRLDAVKEC